MTWYYVPYISAPDTAASSLPCEESPAPFVTLSGTPTQRPLSWRGWMRRDWIGRLSGLTCAPLTLCRGVDAWISSLPAFPVSHSAQPASGEGLTTNGTCGPMPDGSSLRWDRDSCSWRTSPTLFEPDGLEVSWATLPKWGSMRNGVCSQRPPLVPLTSANGSGLWPTPRAVMAPRASAQGTAGPTLTEVATGRDGRTMWPTPKARDRPADDNPAELARNTPRLGAFIVSHHAPTTPTDGPTTSPRVDLNPEFVGALMGLPPGWLMPYTLAGTDSCPSAPEKPGINSRKDCGDDQRVRL